MKFSKQKVRCRAEKQFQTNLMGTDCRATEQPDNTQQQQHIRNQSVGKFAHVTTRACLGGERGRIEHYPAHAHKSKGPRSSSINSKMQNQGSQRFQKSRQVHLSTEQQPGAIADSELPTPEKSRKTQIEGTKEGTGGEGHRRPQAI